MRTNEALGSPRGTGLSLPGLAERIARLKASIPKGDLDGLVARASTRTPAAVLAMVTE